MFQGPGHVHARGLRGGQIADECGRAARARGNNHSDVLRRVCPKVHGHPGQEVIGFLRIGRVDCEPLSFSEKELYAYLQVLRQAGAAPTKADSTLQAVRFVIGILGASMQVSLVVSSRCKGAARAMFETKAPLRQAIPLRAEQVWKLEKLMAWSTDKHLLCVCGFLLFCIYSSSRIGDATRLEKVSFSKAGPVHLVEAQSLLHKGGNTQQRRTKFLPLMALGSCLDVRPWAVTWAVARKDAGLEDSKFLMPALAEHSKSWLRRRMTTAEATQYLRELLVEAGEDFDEAEQVTGHSCKATIPTWVGRHGQFSLDERRLLTHHMDKNNEMVLTYSRDSLTALHTKVYKVLQLIKSAEFNPDAKPAEAIRQALGQDCVEPEFWEDNESEDEEDLFADPSEPVTRITPE